MKRIHKFAAVGGSMTAVALISSALAVGAASAANHGAYSAVLNASTSGSVPNTNIKGKPAHWSPSRLSVTGRWTTPPNCTSAQASFTITNKESKAETITWSGTNGFTPGGGLIAAKSVAYGCITKGYHGTVTYKLSDGKKLKVKA